MYTYTVPFAVRSDSANCSEIDKQVDTSLLTCVQAQICRGTHTTTLPSTTLLTQTHARIPFPSALGQTHRQVILLMLSYIVSRHGK